ncbi:phenylalanine--tRNA ligase subunit beta [Fusobacterium canifelinum]|uniref:Phenylalanine--tRNA ligase beta subunit n=1 Tax=Fusobacterium canifelinum TaxID=285729 RepID=A0A3P1UQ92_9FUSO|nr:phenylalanine--tRNA ligase subunit beta [Fusobacterium canifelinum]RRD24109.1 phenylalanine--tRNA ligase subunit beta [Fusobacterium canifelinum]
MLISLNWLKQYVDIKESIDEIANALTMIGQEVEAIDIQGKDLGNVVIGQIVEFEKHPNSDRLTLLKVNVGEGEPLQIICGAKNHKLNDKVVVAKIGAVLPGNFKIKKSKIRDVESYGMLCSEAELGFAKESEGIIILPEDAPIGTEYREYMGLNDVIFELEITPNRPDCLSHIGIAREVAAYYNRKVKYPMVQMTETIESINTMIKVDIDDKDRCKRYMGRVIKNVKIQESPAWLKSRIRAMGLNPINNIVDITNFVMFEYNQPMHAFDLDKLEGNITIRAAKKDEKITTLDGIDRVLKNGELVIADDEKAIAIAGVIGGQNTQIDNETKNVFVEVAYFTPENIRKTSRDLGIFTDSAYRNERGMDVENLNNVMARAVSLIAEVTGGDILSEVIDKYVEKPQKAEISLNLEKLNKFIGKKLTYDEVGKILTHLDIELKPLGDGTMLLIPPSYRADLTRPADIYEEVIRMYGFDNIEAKMPVMSIEAGEENINFKMSRIVREILKELGLNEVINYSFIPKFTKEVFNFGDEIIEIKNPLSEDMAIMRPTLLYSLITNVRDNINRNQTDLKLFEISKTFRNLGTEKNGLAIEDLKIGIILSGREDKNLWNQSKADYNFYDLKGYLEFLLERLNVTKYSLTRLKDNNFHPGASAEIKIGDDSIGVFGELHPNLVNYFAIKREKLFFAELNLTKLLKYIKIKVNYESISKYPEVLRDLAITLDRDILVGDMIKEIKKKVALIEKIDIFDVYSGDKIDKDKKSVAMSIVLRDKNRTLTDEDIDTAMNTILELIKEKYNGEIRK